MIEQQEMCQLGFRKQNLVNSLTTCRNQGLCMFWFPIKNCISSFVHETSPVYICIFYFFEKSSAMMKILKWTRFPG